MKTVVKNDLFVLFCFVFSFWRRRIRCNGSSGFPLCPCQAWFHFLKNEKKSLFFFFFLIYIFFKFKGSNNKKTREGWIQTAFYQWFSKHFISIVILISLQMHCEPNNYFYFVLNGFQMLTFKNLRMQLR